MMEATQIMIDMLAKCSGCRLFEIPDVCETIFRTIVDTNNYARIFVSTTLQMDESDARCEASVLDRAVRAFYTDLMNSIASYESECANAEASQTAAKWRLGALKLLQGLRVLFKAVGSCQPFYIAACKSIVDHLTRFPAYTNNQARQKMIGEMVDAIQQVEPGYLPPKKPFNWGVFIPVAIFVAVLAAMCIIAVTY